MQTDHLAAKDLSTDRINSALASARPRRLRIFVADDDLGTSESLTAIGNQHGYQVVSVTDGREAFRLLKRDSQFDVAVLSLVTQHLHCVDVVRYMKTEKRLMRIPVIMVSDGQGFRNIPESFAAGATAFLAKPFGPDQLIRALRLVIGNQTPGSLGPGLLHGLKPNTFKYKNRILSPSAAGVR